MVSTDGVADDEERGEESADESVLPPGPRRSTYTPPVRDSSLDEDGGPVGDDALADAMAANLANATDSINVIYQLDDVRPSVPEGVPVEQLPPAPVGARILPADESGSYPGAAPPPVHIDDLKLPSPGSTAVPADLPPPPGETAPPVFDLGEEPVEAPVEAPAAPAVDEVQPPPPFEPAVLPEQPVAEETFVEPVAASVEPEPVVVPGPAPAPQADVPQAPVAEPEPVFIEPLPGSAPPPPLDIVTPPQRTDVPPPYVPFSTPEPAIDPLPKFDEVPFYDRVEPPEEVLPPPTPPEFPPPDPEDVLAPEGTGPVYDLGEEEEEPPRMTRAEALAASGAPAGKPWEPERKSLRDDEIKALMESGADHPGGTLGMMEELERQLKLREEETQEFKDWQQSMLEVGTPEALAAVEKVLPEFADIVSTSAIPIVPPSLADAPPPPLADAPPPALADAPPPPLADAPPPTLADAPPPKFDAPPPVVEPPAIPDAWDMPTGNVIPDSEADPEPAPLVEPAPYSGDPFVDRVFTGAVPVITGSVAIPPQLLDVDRGDDDPVDATDQVPPAFDDLLGAHPGTAPVEPILSPRIPEDEVVLGEAQELERPRVFGLEQAGLEPTPEEQRVGRAARMFWMWFAANSSLVSLAFGAMLFSLGMSLRQAIVGVFAGVAISFLPLGLGTLAGKRSGQPTMVVSRAVFGVAGNGIPAFIALVSRVFWGAAMLWFLGAAVSSILTGASLSGGMSPELLTLISIGGGALLSVLIALFGYGLIAKFQLIVSILSALLIAGFIGLTYQYVDLAAALTFADGSWLLSGTVAVLVFSFVGLLWANSTSDLARYQRPGATGVGSALWATFGTTIPTFILITYGTLLAASNEQLAAAMLENPMDSLGRLLPVWYPAPLIAATALSLVSGIVVTLYSGGFALKSLGMSVSRPVSAVFIGVLVGVVAFLLAIAGTDMTSLFRDLATTLAVPVAAWTGIFAADTMIRRRRFHAKSLLATGGIYPTVNWVNLVGLLIVTAVGFGLTTASLGWLSWQGYVFTLIGVPLDGTLAGTDLGVFAALLLGVLVPLVAGIPAIRRQEAATPSQN
jgi:purine-cytosine permease-like protein